MPQKKKREKLPLTEREQEIIKVFTTHIEKQKQVLGALKSALQATEKQVDSLKNLVDSLEESIKIKDQRIKLLDSVFQKNLSRDILMLC